MRLTYVAEPEPPRHRGGDPLRRRSARRRASTTASWPSTATSSPTSTCGALLRAHERARGAGDDRPCTRSRTRPPTAWSTPTATAPCSSSSRRPASAVPGEINAGAYVLERSVLDLIPPDAEVSIEREVFPRLVGEGLRGPALDGYWMDIGTPDRYLQASWDILEGRVETAGAADRARDCWSRAGAEIAEAPTRRAACGRLGRLPRRLPAPRCANRSCSTAAASARAPASSDSILGPGVTVGPGPTPRRRGRRAGMKESRLPSHDDRRRPRHTRSAPRRPLADRVGPPGAGRGGRGVGLRDGGFGDRRRPRRRRPRRPADPAADRGPRLRAAELGDAGVDRALLQLLGRDRGDAGLLRRRRGARRPPHRRQHRRPARRAAPARPGCRWSACPGSSSPAPRSPTCSPRPPRSAALAGAAPRVHTEIDAAAAFLAARGRGAARARRRDRRPSSTGRSRSIYGGDLTGPVARRWKTQANENAKLPCFYSELPEADHNEICGWTGATRGTGWRPSSSRTATSTRASGAASS